MAVKTLISSEQLIHYRNQMPAGRTLAFVPTMGALHEGHLMLVKQAQEVADEVIVSIFVNPTQFGPNEDFEKYPRTLKDDLEKLTSVGAAAAFLPTTADLYPTDFVTYIYNNKQSQILCGKSRTNHFQGVLTIVLKLFNLVRPHAALFGKKDYQQLFLIKQMVKDLNVSVNVIGCDIIREPNGLAMSSRNRYLSKDHFEIAAEIHRGLSLIKSAAEGGKRSAAELVALGIDHWQKFPQLKAEYLEIRRQSTLDEMDTIDNNSVVLAAVRLGEVRLIDNLEITLI